VAERQAARGSAARSVMVAAGRADSRRLGGRSANVARAVWNIKGEHMTRRVDLHAPRRSRLLEEFFLDHEQALKAVGLAE
jgi:hypothetical protein